MNAALKKNIIFYQRNNNDLMHTISLTCVCLANKFECFKDEEELELFKMQMN